MQTNMSLPKTGKEHKGGNMKTFLKVSAIVLGLFIFIPLVYGVGEVLIESWRDMLPYSWTHSMGDWPRYSHGMHHHRH